MLENLKSQILRDLPQIGMLRPEMEKFNERFDFWFSGEIEKKLDINMDALDLLLYAYAVGYQFGQSAIQNNGE